MNINSHPVCRIGWGVVLRELHNEMLATEGRGAIVKVAARYELKPRTLSRRYKTFLSLDEAQQSTTPWLQPDAPQYDRKGATKRVFTYKEEQEMANKIDEVLADGSGYVVGTT